MREPPVVMCAWIISDVAKTIQLFTYGLVDKPSFVYRHLFVPFDGIIVLSFVQLPI